MAAVTASCAVAPARRSGAQRSNSQRSNIGRSNAGVDPRAVRSSQSGQPVTLTRRGRLVVTLGVVLLALAALVGVAALLLGPAATPAAASGSTSHAALTTITVRSGETLWSIATRVAPNSDPRETVTALREVNNLNTGYVYAGQRLIVPSTR